ncbi:hypothetical protein EYF80_022388 [Liparis tanakae]|uniref:Uncharacterized protein n=1 Tax=Liparis tanakae TaxID=230148 RepID=A0A4Z2HRL0_9TELE|nr:hypothetical protein EYF80_022388 [Liparis tanakae]
MPQRQQQQTEGSSVTEPAAPSGCNTTRLRGPPRGPSRALAARRRPVTARRSQAQLSVECEVGGVDMFPRPAGTAVGAAAEFAALFQKPVSQKNRFALRLKFSGKSL